MNTSTDFINLPELLAPAGDLTRLKAAVQFGADAVFLAGEEFGMRTAATNFGEEDLKTGIEYAHAHGVKVHVTCNTIPHNAEMPRLPAFLEMLDSLGADAIIASDLGTMNMVKKYARQVTPNKKITPHKLRSTYGTNLYKETGDIYLVADVLGHKDVNTTRKHYAAIDEDRRRQAATVVKLRES